jgi:hypothetical protein
MSKVVAIMSMSYPTPFSPGGELCLDETFTREGANDVSTSSAPPNPPLQRTGASVAALPLAPAAERQYR